MANRYQGEVVLGHKGRPISYCPVCCYTVRLRKHGILFLEVGRHYRDGRWRDTSGYGVQCEGEGQLPITREEADRRSELGRT